MKRRIVSLLLALVLLVSLFPMTVLAEDSQTESVLKIRTDVWLDGKETTVELTEIDMAIFNRLEASFVLCTPNGNKVNIGTEYLRFSNHLKYRGTENGRCILEGAAIGTGYVKCTVSGVEYSVPINVTYPDMGLYTAMPFDETTLVDEVTVDEGNNTFYIALAPQVIEQGSKMAAVHDKFGDEIQRPNIKNVSDVELADDGTYAKITVTDPQADGSYHFEATVENTNPYGGPCGTWGRGIRLNNDAPKLYYCYMYRENPDADWGVNYEYPQTDLWSEPGGRDSLCFFFGPKSEIKQGTVAPLPLDSLTFPAYMYSGEFSDYNHTAPENAVDIKTIRFAEESEPTDITYTHDGVVYRISAIPQLPTVGFYTRPTASEAAFIYDGNSFVVTETARDFYLCISDPEFFKLKGINEWYTDGAEELFATSLADDGSYIKFTVKDDATVSNTSYGVGITVQRYNGDNWYEDNYGAWVNLKNGTPGLMFRYMEWDNEKQTWYENEERDFETVVDLDCGESMPVQFYYGVDEAGKNTKVDLSELSFPNGIARGYTQEGIAWVEALGFDETGHITYQTDTVTAKMPVRAEQPSYGLYSNDTASKETYLQDEITLGGEDHPQIYLIARSGRVINQIDYIQNNQIEEDVKDQFGVQLAADGSHAIISLNPNNLPDGGTYYEMRIRNQNGGYWHIHFRLNRGDLEQLATPTNLVWHKEYWQWRDENGNWTLETNDRMGEMGFEVHGLFQNRARVEIFSSDDGYTNSVGGGTWGFGDREDRTHFSITDFIYEDLPSGTYKFRIRAEGDGTQYRNSDWSELSPEFIYTRPEQRLEAPDTSKLKWIKTDYGYAATWPVEAGQQDGAGYFEAIFYWEDENGVKHQSGGTFDIRTDENGDNRYYEAQIHDDILEQHGDVNYYFKVRVIPADITTYRASEFSDFSPALDVENISVNINDKLEDLLSSSDQDTQPTVQDVQDALVNSTADLRTAMAADLELSGGASNGTLALIQELEAAVSDNVAQKIDVKTNAPQEIQNIVEGISMIGATLNLADKHPDDNGKRPTVTLEIDKPKEGIVIGEQQANAVQFSMKLNGAIDKDDKEEAGQQLVVPVVIDMPVPAGINPNFLVVLHKLWDGTIEEIRPYIYTKGNTPYARFVVDSFSDFALIDQPVTLLSSNDTTINVQAVGLDADADRVFAASFSTDGQMLGIDLVDANGLAELENDPDVATVKVFAMNDQLCPLNMMETVLKAKADSSTP